MTLFADPINVATPPGTGESRRMGDDRMRETKRAFLERLAVEHSMPLVAGAGSGRHKFAIGNTAARPTDQSTGTIYINTQTGLLEYWTGAVWAAVNPAYLTLAGGLMTGNLDFNNLVQIRAKDNGGTLRRVAQMAANNHLLLGDLTNAILELQSSAQPTLAVTGIAAGLAGKLWYEHNDGVGSGMDTDLVRGIPVTIISVNATSGFLFVALGYPFIQWGQNTVPGVSSSIIALPTTYASAHYVAVASQAAATANPQDNVYATAHSISQVRVFNNSSGPVAINWISVGL